MWQRARLQQIESNRIRFFFLSCSRFSILQFKSSRFFILFYFSFKCLARCGMAHAYRSRWATATRDNYCNESKVSAGFFASATICARAHLYLMPIGRFVYLLFFRWPGHKKRMSLICVCVVVVYFVRLAFNDVGLRSFASAPSNCLDYGRQWLAKYAINNWILAFRMHQLNRTNRKQPIHIDFR